MTFAILSGLFGGLGLFLLGMHMMTKGLRNAAGPALRQILGKWTKTPLRGLFSGFMITALVQSSSAITVAVIGFVNAGLMNLPQSVGVIYGANIGTTVTGWIVSAVGVNVKIKALALPMIGVGAILRLTGGDSRWKHIGDALTGFGLFFLGIEVLQNAFKSVEAVIDLSAFNIGGFPGLVLFVLIGFALTLVMQSSSAAMALVLTAAMTGVVTLESAAAAVIGTNIGTTTTAGLSVIGATYNAKKVAAAHVLFNGATGLVALFLIPIFLRIADAIPAMSGPTHAATGLAVFHTAFNLLGVVIFLPFTRRLVTFLNEHIGKEFEQLGKPVYLDKNVLNAPTLAMDALFMELGRLGEMTRQTCQEALSSKFRHRDFIRNRASIDELTGHIRAFCVKMQHMDLPDQVATRLPRALRVIQYYRKTLNVINEVFKGHPLLDLSLQEPAKSVAHAFRRNVRDILNVAHTPCAEEFEDLDSMLLNLHDHYQDLKEELLLVGAKGDLEIDRMVALLDYYSRMRQMCEQAAKGTIYWSRLRSLNITCANADEENQYAWKPEE
ncbi:Na/Pi cotransporter family protein [Pseudodesulfovibrio cashew]|uniref:Na/Pi cotransporter family protein n=1 Tax=Pseudodesulfovibrio cashew TaxID=2678688 RepID=A0A6I6JDV8_9BACT|nr:Na/Pi symporter [Pseudodesulfovibrio cashew]QGY41036.1 Na/Pi cotransporter family protein [Pseudodesulfovibrio cashew]